MASLCIHKHYFRLRFPVQNFTLSRLEGKGNVGYCYESAAVLFKNNFCRGFRSEFERSRKPTRYGDIRDHGRQSDSYKSGSRQVRAWDNADGDPFSSASDGSLEGGENESLSSKENRSRHSLHPRSSTSGGYYENQFRHPKDLGHRRPRDSFNDSSYDARGRSWGDRGPPGRSIFNRGSMRQKLKAVNWDTVTLSEFKKDFYEPDPVTHGRSSEEVQTFLKTAQASIKGQPPVPKPIFDFNELKLPSSIFDRLKKLNIKAPTTIQKIGLPLALSGRDMIGVSQTGSGKTLAFLVPGLVHLDAQPPISRGEGPIILVLAPTRELATQIYDQAELLSSRAKLALLIGGVPSYSQLTAVRKGVDIVVACPGRLLQFLEDGEIRLNRTTYLVLDEADRMLDMGFEPQIRQVVSQIRPDRQTLLFSATWPDSIEELASDLCKSKPVLIKVGQTELSPNKDIQQNFEFHQGQDKLGKVIKCLKEQLKDTQQRVLVFCNKKSTCRKLRSEIIRHGVEAEDLHSDKTQTQREYALADFKAGTARVLVATDIAARGIDVPNVTVLNFDLPGTVEDYVHRIGRSGRAGNPGLSISYLNPETYSTNERRLVNEIFDVVRAAGQQPPKTSRQSYF